MLSTLLLKFMIGLIIHPLVVPMNFEPQVAHRLDIREIVALPVVSAESSVDGARR
jgi:hypothetical protein